MLQQVAEYRFWCAIIGVQPMSVGTVRGTLDNMVE